MWWSTEHHLHLPQVVSLLAPHLEGGEAASLFLPIPRPPTEEEQRCGASIN